MVVMANNWNSSDNTRSRRTSFNDAHDQSRLNGSFVSVVEDSNEFVIEAEVDGLIPSNLMVSIEDHWMYVSGDRLVDIDQEGEMVRVRVPFDSVVDLPFNAGERYYLDINDNMLQFRFPKTGHSVRDAA